MAGEKQTEDEFCPKVTPIDKDMLDLDYSDKLKLVEDEARSLYSFCLKQEFSAEEMKACMAKFRGPGKTVTKKALHDSTRSFVYFSIFVAIIGVFWQSETLYNWTTVHAKLGMIKVVLPYWNWAGLYGDECFISNPYLHVPNTTYNKRTCQYCINVVQYGDNVIDRLNATSPDEITKHYIENDQPVVVTDATKSWGEKLPLNMDELAKIYQTNSLLSTAMGSCMYSSNVGFNETFYDFITAYVDGKLPENWHFTWQNCDQKAAKIIRKYYSRPYFLPAMAQAGSENTLIVAKGKHTEESFEALLSAGGSAHWLTVVTGSLTVQLMPYEPCMEKYACKMAEVNINAGETVFFNAGVWLANYHVTSDNMTLAIGSSVIWDEL